MDLFEKGKAVVSEIGKRVQQEIVDRSRDLPGLASFAAGDDDKPLDIRKVLDSKFDKEKIDGLKRLILLISKGKNVSEYFADVVKNVASPSFEVRKLVYIYLLRYAEEEPDLALLSINTFQKDLTDKNALIRAMALRVMSSIRVQVIVPLIMLSLKKGTVDLSPYVRKAAANAIPKCYSLDPTQKEHLLEIIESMLSDNSTLVLGSVIYSFNQICPDRLDLVHKHFRKLCRLVVDADEWSQMEILGLLLRYCRSQFLDPNESVVSGGDGVTGENPAVVEKKDFYDDDPPPAAAIVDVKGKSNYEMDPDHALFLKSCLQLLQSRNASVVMTVVKIFIHIAPAEDCHRPIKALIRVFVSSVSKPPSSNSSMTSLLATAAATVSNAAHGIVTPSATNAEVVPTSAEEQYLILLNMVTITTLRPTLLQPYVARFYLNLDEPSHIRDLKLEMLTLLANSSNVSGIIREFRDYVRSNEVELVVGVVRCLGRLALRLPEVAGDSLGLLRVLISSDNERIVAEAVVVTRQLVQLHPKTNSRLIVSLARSLDKIKVAQARASIFWLVGQHCAIVPQIAPDVFRKAAKGFSDEHSSVKLQILNLGIKLVANLRAQEGAEAEDVKCKETVGKIWDYVSTLAKFDMDYDVRDRSRFLKALMARYETSPDSLVGVVLKERATPVEPSRYAGRENFTLGSLSHAVNSLARNYTPLPDWPTTKPDPSPRNYVDPAQENWNRDSVVSGAVKEIRRAGASAGGGSATASGSGGIVKPKRVVDLDNFLASESEEEEEVEEDDDDDDDDEEEEDEEDEESEEEDESEDDDEDEEEYESEDEEADGDAAVKASRN